MAMGFCTSGSAAKTVALKPGGKCIFAAASTAGIGLDWSGSELYGRGNSDADNVNESSSGSSVFFIGFAFSFRSPQCDDKYGHPRGAHFRLQKSGFHGLGMTRQRTKIQNAFELKEAS